MEQYYYGMRCRGFSLGCQPKKGLIAWHDCDPGQRWYSIITYDRELSEDEIQQYELDIIVGGAKKCGIVFMD